MARNTETVLAELRELYIGRTLVFNPFNSYGPGTEGKVISIDYDPEVEMNYYRAERANGTTFSVYESEIYEIQ